MCVSRAILLDIGSTAYVVKRIRGSMTRRELIAREFPHTHGVRWPISQSVLRTEVDSSENLNKFVRKYGALLIDYINSEINIIRLNTIIVFFITN